MSMHAPLHAATSAVAHCQLLRCHAGGTVMRASAERPYSELRLVDNPETDACIMRDLSRTFPDHVFFHQRQGPGQQALYHVLRAYAASDAEVGGCAGL
jgi:hypothetical protein